MGTSPITWKNVGSTISGDSAGKTMAGAVKTVDSAFAPLRESVNDVTKVVDQNELQRVKNVNQAEQAKVQDIGSLAEYHKMKDEGAFDEGAARERLGYAFDAKGAKKAQTDQLGVLRDEAVKNAMPGAYEVSDDDLDLTGGARALGEQLEAAGMAPDEIAARKQTFLTQNAAKQAEYIKTKENNLNKHLADTGAFKTSAEINTHLDSLGAKPGFDREELASRLTKEMVNNRADLSYDQKQKEFKRVQHERELTDVAYNNIMTNLPKTGDIQDVSNMVKNSGLSATGQMSLLSKVLPVLQAQAAQKPRQKLIYDQKVNAMTQDAVAKNTADAQRLGTMKASYNAAIGFQPTTDKILEQSALNGVHVYDLVLGDMQKTTGFWNSFFNVDVKSDDTAMAVVDSERDKLIALGVGDKDADRLIYTGMQQTKSDNQYIGKGSGVNKVKFNDAMSDLYAKYKAQENQRLNIVAYENDSAVDRTNRQNQITLKSAALLATDRSMNLGHETTVEEEEAKFAVTSAPTGSSSADDNLKANLKASREKQEALANEVAEDKLAKSIKAEKKVKNNLGQDPAKWDVTEESPDKTGIDNLPAGIPTVLHGAQSIKNFVTGLGSKGLNKLIEHDRKKNSPSAKKELYVTGKDGKKHLMTAAEEKLFKAAKK